MASQVKRKRSNIYGWESEMDVAGEIYCGPFRGLLEGNLVFAYKNLGTSGTIRLLVITKTQKGFRFGYLPLSGGWTCYYPIAPTEYILDVLLSDLQKNKTEKYIIEDFIDCIKYYDKA